MFEFQANYLFITSEISEDDRYDNVWGLIGFDSNTVYMMMRERNSTSFQRNTGLGFRARRISGSSYYGMGRIDGNTFQWYIQNTSETTNYARYQFNRNEITYSYVAF